jgi:uncharacterized membrane protein YjjP (DUF1212 family)
MNCLVIDKGSISAMNMTEEYSNVIGEGEAFGTLLLDIGLSLLQAGANSGRVRISMSELASAYQYVPYIIIRTTSIFLILKDKKGNTLFDGVKRTSKQGINFAEISRVIKLGRMAADGRWSFKELREEFDRRQTDDATSQWLVNFFVGLSGAAFCYTFGGDLPEMGIAFGATYCGLIVKGKLTKANFNSYLSTYIAATVSSLLAGLFHITGLIISPINAFSTCVLFLVPGVPLINSFIDLMEGNTLNGVYRGVKAFAYILAIALGLLTTLFLLDYKSK